jgi:sterol desaturase/sphingolipid hydroxylase (fatty acid hydroxylase superfamily)
VTADRSVAVLAHGLGGSTDLPIPLSYALIGAAWALTFTFAVVAVAWRRPRFDPDKPGRALPRWVTTVVDAPATRWVVAIAALLFAVWVAVAAAVGPQGANNPLPGVFYVLLWVGLVARSRFGCSCTSP